MNAYEILAIVLAALLIPIGIYAIWGKECALKTVVRCAAVAIFICVVLLCFGVLAGSNNDDYVVELRVWRQMVENGEIEVFDDVGHLTWEAQEYNIEIAVMQDDIARCGRWSQYYGTGAETLLPITKED